MVTGKLNFGWKKRSRKRLSSEDNAAVKGQERNTRRTLWGLLGNPIENRTLKQVEDLHGISFASLIPKLTRKFPGQRLQVLDEAAGKSSLARELRKDFGRSLKVTKTDIRRLLLRGVKNVNVIDLLERFGKNRFHLIISSGGGAYRSPLQEEALRQIVSVLKPGGIGAVSTTFAKDLGIRRNPQKLENKFNIKIKWFTKGNHGFVFTKNLSGKK